MVSKPPGSRQNLLLVMAGSDDGSDEHTITNNHDGYEGLTDAEADKVSYWADWVELNAVAPLEPPKPPPNFNFGYSTISNRCEEDNGRHQLTLYRESTTDTDPNYLPIPVKKAKL
ncbi:unnamed protein product [Umbelopsis ramanniana]